MAKPIDSASQLMALLGNNAELIVNGTSIGNPNASTAEKMATNESNAGGNQTGNQSGSPQQGSAGNHQAFEFVSDPSEWSPEFVERRFANPASDRQ